MLPGMEPGRETLLFQEVNDRIYDLVASAEPDLPAHFLCECGRGCERRVALRPAAFAALRRSGEVVRAVECRRRRRRRRAGRPAHLAGGLPAPG